jgi:hypothetical protein
MEDNKKKNNTNADATNAKNRTEFADEINMNTNSNAKNSNANK